MRGVAFAGVTWKPNINVRDATNDMALVLASDGLWDVMYAQSTQEDWNVLYNRIIRNVIKAMFVHSQSRCVLWMVVCSF